MDIETIRRHCAICGVDTEMPRDTLGGMAIAPAMIAKALSEAGLAAAEGWSAGEVAVHLADTEVVTGWRIRQTLAEDTPELQPYDQEKWAAALHYRQRDATAALEAFSAARRANLEILRLLTDEDWERTYIQPEYGRMTLRALIRHKSDHDLAHLKQIRGV